MTEYGQTVVLLRDPHRDRLVSEPLPAEHARALTDSIITMLASDDDEMTVGFNAWGSGPAVLTRSAVRGAFTDTWEKKPAPPTPAPWYGQVDCATEDRLLAEQAARERDEPVPWGEPGDNPTPQLVRRQPPRLPRIIATAREDITAGATVVLDLTTGLVSIHHPDQEQQ
jgi:hypothetical protein